MKPYYEVGGVVVYLGDMREILSKLEVSGGVCITDPPYGETSLGWDRWVDGWPSLLDGRFSSLWCFGSMRMFLARGGEFLDGGWRMSQDLVWEKHNGSGFHADRFKRVHEHAVHWFRGEWGSVYKSPVMTMDAAKRTVRSKSRPPHTGHIERTPYESKDGGPKLMRSVFHVPSCHGTAVHPTQKPLGVIWPLVEYSVPEGGVVVDPFCGAGSTLVAARDAGRRAIGIEADERYCEATARRLHERLPLEECV